jgi:hypothetical protein
MLLSNAQHQLDFAYRDSQLLSDFDWPAARVR